MKTYLALLASLRLFGAAVLFASILIQPSAAASSAEIPIGLPELVPPPHGSWHAAAASDGENFLVVWHDQRAGFDQSALLAARIARNGEVLDPTGIVLARNTGAAPIVVWTGDAYVIVWSGNEVFAARIGRDGAILTAPHVIGAGALTTTSSVATNGNTIVVTTLGPGLDFSSARALVLDRETNVVADHQLAGTDIYRGHISVASNGDGYLVVWNAFPDTFTTWPQGELEGVRLDARGKPIDTSPRPLGPGIEPKLASDGTDYLVAARQASGLAPWTTRFVSGDLSRVESLEVLPDGAELFGPSLVRSGGRYLFISVRSPNFLQAIGIDDAGSPANGPSTLQTASTYFTDAPAAATNGREILTVWIERAGDAATVLRAKLFDAISLDSKSAPIDVTKAANEQRSPAIAFDGSDHLVVWTERSGVWATRIRDGVSLDGRGVRLSEYDTPYPPRVVFDGRSYVIAWVEVPFGGPGEIVFRMLRPDTGIPGEALRVAVRPYGPVALATSGEATLAVWSDNLGTTPRAVRIDRETQTVSSPIALSPPGRWALWCAVAWNGTEFLVAWSEVRTDELYFPHPTFSGRRIVGVRVSSSLGARDPEPLILATGPSAHERPALASDGADWLLTWETDENMRARRIAAPGVPEGDPSGIVVANNSYGSTVEWDGTRYAIVWHAWRDLPGFRTRLAFLSRDLEVTPAVEVTGSEPPGDANFPIASVARSRERGIAVVYTRPAWEPMYGGVTRAFMKTFGAPRRRAVR